LFRRGYSSRGETAALDTPVSALWRPIARSSCGQGLAISAVIRAMAKTLSVTFDCADPHAVPRFRAAALVLREGNHTSDPRAGNEDSTGSSCLPELQASRCVLCPVLDAHSVVPSSRRRHAVRDEPAPIADLRTPRDWFSFGRGYVSRNNQPLARHVLLVVYARQPTQLDVDAQLLANLPPRRVGWRLARIDEATD